MAKMCANISIEFCVACGACMNACPKNAISVYNGRYAVATEALCVGCGMCKRTCPAGVIDIVEESAL